MPKTISTKSGDSALVKVPGLPGIYRRHATGCTRGDRCGCPYVIIYRGADAGQQRETFRTRAEAIEGKRLAARRVALAKAHAIGLHRDRPEDEVRSASVSASSANRPNRRYMSTRASGSRPTRAPAGAAFAKRRATSPDGCWSATRLATSPIRRG
jgi:hypothetical protein